MAKRALSYPALKMIRQKFSPAQKAKMDHDIERRFSIITERNEG
jgi:hypothetical protein